MARRCANLLLTVSLVSGVVTAQTEKEIAAAINRLEGERLDARAMEFLIDAGEPAVEPLARELNGVVHDPGNPRFARILCVLRAIGPEAENACPAPVQARIDDGPPTVVTRPKTTLLFAMAPGNANRRVAMPKWPFDARIHSSLPGHLRRSELIEARAEGSDPPPALDGADVVERELAADLLGPSDRDALPRLLALLENEEHPMRVAVNEGQSTFLLRYTQEFANAVVWDAAAKAIARIDPDHPKAARGLALMVESADDPRDRVRAAMALGQHGDTAKEYVDVLLTALDSDDDRVVAEAVTAIGMVGVKTDDVLDRLRDLTSDDRPAIARRAEATLRSLEGREGGR